MKKQMAAVAMGAALLGGGAIGATLMTPTISSADSSSSSTGSTTAANGSGSDEAKPGAWVDDVFEKLVSDGTITQAQADKVQAALEAARPEGGPGGPGGPRGRGPGLDAAAEALGIDASELRTDLQSGKTLADVAKDKGVDVQTVIDALVAEMQSHLADAVSSGRLTQAQADEMKANATERATAIVNGERPDGPPPGMGFGGPGGPGSPSSSSDSGSGSTSSTTS
jgi:hypothetical protein